MGSAEQPALNTVQLVHLVTHLQTPDSLLSQPSHPGVTGAETPAPPSLTMVPLLLPARALTAAALWIKINTQMLKCLVGSFGAFVPHL